MKRVLVGVLSLVLAGSASAGPAPQAAASGTNAKKAKTPSVATQLKTMSDAIDAQQKQIEQLRQELQSRDQIVQQLQQRLDQSQAAAQAAQAQAAAAAAAAADASKSTDVQALRNDVNDLKQNESTTAQTIQETQKNLKEAIESPIAIHYKGITLTPGGFLAAETVNRTRALGADINTPFNSIPYPGASQASMSEFFGSGRQSRLSLLAEGKLASAKIGGYYEADFLSAGITSNNNQSNSYTLRQRQLWAQAALNSGWTFTGGQMWSLVTETKNGVDNRTEAVPMTIDPQYTVGFSWARQYGFRVSKKIGDHFWGAFSVENSQETLTAHGANNNFLIGSAGSGGGLYNSGITASSTNSTTFVTTCTNAANYSFNPTPDFVLKLVAQGGPLHFEVFGLVTQFRDRIFPCALTTGKLRRKNGAKPLGAYNDSPHRRRFRRKRPCVTHPQTTRPRVPRFRRRRHWTLWNRRFVRCNRSSGWNSGFDSRLSGSRNRGVSRQEAGLLSKLRRGIRGSHMVQQYAGYSTGSARLRLASVQEHRLRNRNRSGCGWIYTRRARQLHR